MQNHPNCCNDNCNQGRDCPVRAGTHKPAEALHQIQEPAAAEQAAWHAGLDEGRAQAAPAAVAVPDERAAFEDWMSEGGKFPRAIERAAGGGYKLMSAASYWEAWKARAALAATPAADALAGWKLVPMEPTAEMLERAGATDRDGTPATYKTLYMAMVGASPAAAPVVLPEPDSWREGAKFALEAVSKVDSICWLTDSMKEVCIKQAAEAVIAERDRLRALLATGGQAQAVEKSATHGMNLGQRILHVGGRENAQTYIEFGSVAAVRALVDQVLRDLPDGAPGFVLPAPQAQVDARDADQVARFKAQHELLNWNRAQQTPPIAVSLEYVVFKQAIDLYRAAIAAANGEQK